MWTYALFFAAAAVQYTVAERVGRRAYRLGYRAEQGPYRESSITVDQRVRRAPIPIRVAAFAFILFGQFAVVFAPLALRIVAAVIWLLGYALLLGLPRRRALAPRSPAAPQLPRWLVRLLQRKRRRAAG